jgi:hypothetical protein
MFSSKKALFALALFGLLVVLVVNTVNISTFGSRKDMPTLTLKKLPVEGWFTAALSGAKTCAKAERAFPECNECIFGLEKSSCTVSREIETLREELRTIAQSRYSNDILYPYLLSGEMRARQAMLGYWLKYFDAKNVLDIGAYASPILDYVHDYCPTSYFVIEPMADLITKGKPYASGSVRCPAEVRSWILVTISPATADKIAKLHPEQPFDALICIGCDGVHGPKQDDFFNPRAVASRFVLLLEYSSKYRPSLDAYEKLPDFCEVVVSADFKLHNFTMELQQYRRMKVYICDRSRG